MPKKNKRMSPAQKKKIAKSMRKAWKTRGKFVGRK